MPSSGSSPRLSLLGFLMADTDSWAWRSSLGQLGYGMAWMPIISQVCRDGSTCSLHVFAHVYSTAIDNATRRIVSVPQTVKDGDGNLSMRQRRPVTVGLFFSLGHSTIVFATILAIAISVNVADNLDGFGDVGGIIGASVSGSFLFLIGCINTVILYRTWRRLQASKKRMAQGEVSKDEDASHTDFHGIMTRLAAPILRSVDRPWKLYPIGVLFGLGFDTASSIALLSVTALAQQDSLGGSGTAKVVLLAFLFTAGMTIVDSADSCLMIWAYAPDMSARKFSWFQKDAFGQQDALEATEKMERGVLSSDEEKGVPEEKEGREHTKVKEEPLREHDAPPQPQHTAHQAYMEEKEPVPTRWNASLDTSASKISLVLTLLSIMVAFAISIIVLVGLIGDQCARCSAAADRQEQSGDGGLEGRWWLAWRQANDNSGYVGAGIVGVFALCVVGYFGGTYIRKRWAKSRTVV